MKLKRYEILLPLVYNDGEEIEKEKFFQTNEELVNRFGATTTDSIIAAGSWLYKGVLYNDKLLRIRVDADDSQETRNFFIEFKEKMKNRFKQIDIWITAYEIETV